MQFLKFAAIFSTVANLARGDDIYLVNNQYRSQYIDRHPIFQAVTYNLILGKGWTCNKMEYEHTVDGKPLSDVYIT